MRIVQKLIVLFAVLLVAHAAEAGKVREVSVKKIIKAGGTYTLDASESQIGIRVRTSESVRPRKGSAGLKTAASKKEGRKLFVAGAGKFVAELKDGSHTLTILAGDAEKPARRETREPERRERPRLNPDIERYTTDGKIDFSKLHRGLYGGGGY